MIPSALVEVWSTRDRECKASSLEEAFPTQADLPALSARQAAGWGSTTDQQDKHSQPSLGRVGRVDQLAGQGHQEENSMEMQF